MFHLFKVGNGKEAAVGQSRAGRRAASLVHRIDHGQQRAVVGGVLRHPLGHDQVVVGDRDLARVAQRKAAAPAQKTRILVGAREPLQAALVQPFKPSRQFVERPRQLGDGHIESAGLGVIAIGGLLPTAHLAAQRGPRRAQRLLAVYAVPAGVGLDARRVNRHPAQLHHALRLRPLQPGPPATGLRCWGGEQLRKRVVQCAAMAAAKRAQSPVIHPLAAGQIAKCKVFDHATLHLPRAGDAQGISVKPNAQHQPRRIQLAALDAVAQLKHAHIQSLHNAANKKAEMIRTQLIAHAGRQQIRLIRTVRLESRHTTAVAQIHCENQVLRRVLTQTL